MRQRLFIALCLSLVHISAIAVEDRGLSNLQEMVQPKPAATLTFQFQFSSRFPNKKGEGKFRVIIRSPDGTETKSHKYSVAYPPAKFQIVVPAISGIYQIITDVTSIEHNFGVLYYNVVAANSVNKHVYYSTMLVTPAGAGRTVNSNPVSFP